MAPTLFQKLLGAPFFTMPAPVRALHAVRGHGRYAGRVTVVRSRNPLARLCAWMAGLPRTMTDAPLTVELTCSADEERWHRDFDGRPMRSRLRLRNGLLHERLGLVHFRFALHVNDGALYWNVAGARVFGLLPLPAAWLADAYCREGEREGRYAFLVEASLPLLGSVVRYEGWLEPASEV